MAKKETWEIILTKPVEKVYVKSSKAMRRRLDSCFEALEISPLYGNNIKALTGELKGLLRYRLGDWRVIYRVFHDKRIVEVIAILPRGNAYK